MGKPMTKYVVPIFVLALMTYFTFTVENRTLMLEVAESQTQTIKTGAIRNRSPPPTAGEVVMPKKIISVIGLESSGTQFMTDVIAKAVGVHGRYRDGSFADKLAMNDDGVHVQHFSLPWGSACQSHPKRIVQKVVLPFPCNGPYNKMHSSCQELAVDANFTISDPDKPIYPERYFLDIVANKEWYESKGVEQVFVIVIRDKTVSFTSRVGHCNLVTLREQEEELGTQIINSAIEKYILNGTDKGRQLSSSLPSGNNVFLVSYETLLKLKEVYIRMIYDALGIESDYVPIFKDGNEKYVTAPKKIQTRPYASEPVVTNQNRFVGSRFGSRSVSIDEMKKRAGIN